MIEFTHKSIKERSSNGYRVYSANGEVEIEKIFEKEVVQETTTQNESLEASASGNPEEKEENNDVNVGAINVELPDDESNVNLTV